jgi:hypothetical protein
MYTPAAIIDIAKVSQYMVANDQQRRGLLSGGTDPRWSRMLYVERGSVEWMYGLDSTHTTLEKTAYYLYSLCGKWALLAQAAMRAAGVVPGGGTTSDGSVINPETGSAVAFDFEYLIPIKGTDFSTTNLPTSGLRTRYDDTRITGHSLQVFWNEVNRYLEWGSEIGYTDTGIEILIDGFDAATTHSDATFKIYIKDPDVYSDAPSGGGTTTESGGTAVAYDADGTYLIPAGSILESVVILPGSNTNVKIGTASGLEDLMPETAVTTDGYMVVLNLFSKAGRTIYFTGIPAGSTIVFFTKAGTLS